MQDNGLRKIVYFDRETINNALQRMNDGAMEKLHLRSSSTSFEANATAGSRLSTNLGVPFFGRLKFLLSGRIDLSYLHEWDSRTTVSSTDISLFHSIENDLTPFLGVQLHDVKNSLTSFRVAATFLKLVKSSNQEINAKEMADLLSSMEGYDLYDIGGGRYVRFNQKAYLSNYKRNDISMSALDLYCVNVGNYMKSDFDFINKLDEMQSLFDISDTQKKTLGEMFFEDDESSDQLKLESKCEQSDCKIKLYDVLCAYVSEPDHA